MSIINKEIKLIDAVKMFLGGKQTLEKWVAAYKQEGKAGLISKSTILA